MTEPAVSATRSWLFTPGTRPDRFAKASAVGADVAIIDLEDSVAPNEKESAREVALGYLASPRSARARIALRINGLDKAAGVADVNALLHVRTWPDFLVLPKTETSGHLQILDHDDGRNRALSIQVVDPQASGCSDLIGQPPVYGHVCSRTAGSLTGARGSRRRRRG